MAVERQGRRTNVHLFFLIPGIPRSRRYSLLDARVVLDLGSLDHFIFSWLKREAVLGFLRPLLVQICYARNNLEALRRVQTGSSLRHSC